MRMRAEKAEAELERLAETLEGVTARMHMTVGAFQAHHALGVEMTDEHRLNAVANLEEAIEEVRDRFSAALRALEVDEDAS